MTQTNTEFNFKEFILTEVPTIEDEVKEQKVRTKPAVNYTVEWKDHCDCIISRETAKTQQWLVLMVSQGQFYVKGKDGKIEQLTEENLHKFLKDYSEGDLAVDLNWLGSLSKGKNANYWILKYLQMPKFLELCKKNLVYFDKSSVIVINEFLLENLNVSFLQKVMKLFNFAKEQKQKVAQLLCEVPDGWNTPNNIEYQILKVFFNNKRAYIRDEYENSSEKKIAGGTWYELWPYGAHSLKKDYFFLDVFLEKFGESGTYQFFEELYHQYKDDDITDIKLNYGKINEILINGEFQCSKFIDYLVYGPIEQGYSLGTFISTWTDTLRGQCVLYGEIRDKYPKCLADTHQRVHHYLNIQRELKKKEEVEENNLKCQERKEALQKLLWKPEGKEFFITAPSSANEIIEEGKNMCNCIGSYLSSYANGTSNIFFLRRQATPDVALCDIEVRDGNITQAYLSHNKRPTDSIRLFIQEWAKKNGLEY